MSLGGYIFRGYTCSKPSGISNTDWYLLIHKTRVKAFLEASNAADAGWVIDHTGGQIAFESTSGAIYRLDDLGYNYITTFKIPNEDAYFQILTLCNWTTDTADLANGMVCIRTPIDYSYVYSNTVYMSRLMRTTMFHRVGTVRKTPDLSANKYGMSSLFTAGSMFETGNSSGHKSCNADNESYVFPNYNCKYGYAIKGKHIISVIMNGSNLYFSLLSADVYSVRFNNSDKFVSYNAINFTSRSPYNNNSTYGEASIKSNVVKYYATSYIKGNSSYNISQAYIPLRTSNYTQATTIYPFSSVYISTIEDTQDIKSNGIGSIPVDLLSTNTTTGTLFDIGTVVANGNYICVGSSSGTIYVIGLSNDNISGWGSNYYVKENIFLGWDPSNPNLSESSSWPIYREPVPYTYTSHNVGNTIHYTVTLTGVSGNGTVHVEGYIIESNSSGQAQHREINGNYNYTNGSFDLTGNWPYPVSGTECYLQISFV